MTIPILWVSKTSVAEPALRIVAPGSQEPGHLVLHARAALGPGHVGKTRHHRILTSHDLSPGSWLVLPGGEVIPGDNLDHRFSLAMPPAGSEYFRV